MRTGKNIFLIILTFSLSQGPSWNRNHLALHGFTNLHSRSERQLEERFLAIPDPVRAEAIHKVLTREPHPAGSPGDFRTAEYVLKEFRSFGLDAQMEQSVILDSVPREIKFELLAPRRFTGPHPEYVEIDPASRDPRIQTAFNAYSDSGDVTSEVVYANYGLPADYAFLLSHGISVAGKIVIVRYGACYRGVKAKVAGKNKVAGLIIYSDPQDDGYHVGDAYPRGPWRPASGVQRGSVLYEFDLPGKVAADRSNVPHFPVIPLSYADAQPILRNIHGVDAPRDWQGGLPFTYHVGPGPARVRMQVRMNYEYRSIWNVVAKIPGTGVHEEIVLAGNHRDAWIYGGADPNSGTTALLEVSRALGTLLHDGWRPRRSIWLCSWDGEELGEFGSVNWAEKHAEKLQSEAVAYLNVDTAVSGDQLSLFATPSLKQFLLEVAADIPGPSGVSLLQQANQQWRSELMKLIKPDRPAPVLQSLIPVARQEFQVTDLGGGTDFIAFFDHLGIPAADMEFEGLSGEYHSVFDNHRWMKQFGDPTFEYHAASARLLGLATLRLADTDLLPLDYATYGNEIGCYVKGVEDKLALEGDEGQLDFEPTKRAAEELNKVAQHLIDLHGPEVVEAMPEEDLYQLNRRLVRTEGAFLLSDGLPGRPWYRHAFFAPGEYSGYDAVPLPGVLESVDAEHYEEARQQLELITTALHRATTLLQDAP